MFAAFVQYVIEEQPVEQVRRDFELSPNRVYNSKWQLTRKLSEKMKELLTGAE